MRRTSRLSTSVFGDLAALQRSQAHPMRLDQHSASRNAASSHLQPIHSACQATSRDLKSLLPLYMWYLFDFDLSIRASADGKHRTAREEAVFRSKGNMPMPLLPSLKQPHPAKCTVCEDFQVFLSQHLPHRRHQSRRRSKAKTYYDGVFLDEIYRGAFRCSLCRFIQSLMNESRPGQLKNLMNEKPGFQIVDYGGVFFPDRSDPQDGKWCCDDAAPLVNQRVFRIEISLRAFSISTLQWVYPFFCTQPTINSSLLGRTIGSRVDCRLVKYWLLTCRADHEQCRRFQESHYRDLPSSCRVVDLLEKRVVSMPAKCKYAALSYVWGDAGQLRLTESNFDHLTSVGGLKAFGRKLTRSIKDAMVLCSDLDFRYLWVDALCIRQDDPAELELQCSNMDAIFRNASLTLVSAAGTDSNGGLPGVRGHTRPSLMSFEFKGFRLQSTLPALNRALSSSKWDSRAWTFQERVFSARLLIFTERQMYWKCTLAQWCEDTVHESLSRDGSRRIVPDYAKRDEHLGLIGQQIHDLDKRAQKWDLNGSDLFHTYCSHLEQYSKRKLTHNRDSVLAFLGVLRALNWTHEHVNGLPTSHFADALAWSIYGKLSPKDRYGIFPSWTWAEWRGSKRHPSFESSVPVYVPHFYTGSPPDSHMIRDGSLPIGTLWGELADSSGPWTSFKYPYSFVFRILLEDPRNLIFWTSACSLYRQTHGSGEEWEQGYHLKDRKGGIRAFLNMDWLSAHSFYAIAISARQSDVTTIQPLLVRRIGFHKTSTYTYPVGIYERVPENIPSIEIDDWNEMRPTWELFVLQ